jgi:hypothetical protein
MFEISALYVPTIAPAAAPAKENAKGVASNEAAPQDNQSASAAKKGARP